MRYRKNGIIHANGQGSVTRCGSAVVYGAVKGAGRCGGHCGQMRFQDCIGTSILLDKSVALEDWESAGLADDSMGRLESAEGGRVVCSVS